MKLLVNDGPEVEALLADPAHAGWARLRHSPRDGFILLEVDNAALRGALLGRPGTEVLPHLSTSVGRLKGGLRGRLGGHIKGDSSTVADLLEGMGVTLK